MSHLGFRKKWNILVCMSSLTNNLRNHYLSWRCCHFERFLLKTIRIIALFQERHINQSNQKISEEVLYAVLGLLMNLTLERSDNSERFAVTITQHCLSLLPLWDHQTATAGVIFGTSLCGNHSLPWHPRIQLALATGLVANIRIRFTGLSRSYWRTLSTCPSNCLALYTP